jgi:hypothetical protein
MLTRAETDLRGFIDAHPELEWTHKYGGGEIRGGPCRWIRVIKHTQHGPTAISLGWWNGQGWCTGMGAATPHGAYKNANHVHTCTFPTFVEAAAAFLSNVRHLV